MDTTHRIVAFFKVCKFRLTGRMPSDYQKAGFTPQTYITHIYFAERCIAAHKAGDSQTFKEYIEELRKVKKIAN